MKNLPVRPKLKDLAIGEKFYFANPELRDKNMYEVVSLMRCNKGIGSHRTRDIKNTKTGEVKSLVCAYEVIKVHECAECGCKVPDGNRYCNECEIV